jgi:hypothetical protein
MRHWRILGIGVLVAGLALLLAADSNAAQPRLRPPLARTPAHSEILDLHSRVIHGPVSRHLVQGQVFEIRHVANGRVPGAKVGKALPPGHYPVAKLTVPGVGEHHLSLMHDGGRWRVFAADPDGRVVHEAPNAQVSAVRSGRLPPHSITGGGIVGLPPEGNSYFVSAASDEGAVDEDGYVYYGGFNFYLNIPIFDAWGNPVFDPWGNPVFFTISFGAWW